MIVHRVPGDIDHLLRLLGDLLGLRIADVGCGRGAFTALLAGHGASAVGIEVTADRVAEAQAGHDGPAFLLGRGETLPLADGSQDVIVYLRSLHHVPVDALDSAIAQARRVLAADGVLYIVEPLPEGDYHALVSLVEDETAVRAAAQAAIARAAADGFTHAHSERYDVLAPYRDLDDVRARIVGVDPARGPVFDAHRDELQRRFDAGGELRGLLRWYAQPQQVDVLRASSD